MENSLYEGLVEHFPDSYSSGAFNTADSGKLLVLSDLLTSIRQLSPSDRYVCVCVRVSGVCMCMDVFLSMYNDKVCVPLQSGRSFQLY